MPKYRVPYQTYVLDVSFHHAYPGDNTETAYETVEASDIFEAKKKVQSAHPGDSVGEPELVE